MGRAGDVAGRTYPEGVPSWVETEQSDVEAAIEFYGSLFGWTFQDAMPTNSRVRYVIAKLGGADVGAIAGPGQGMAAWSTYIAVDDADAAAQWLLSAGATVRSQPADVGEGGRGAVLTDPEGVEFRIWQARRRVGAQAVNLPGGWNFSDLHTTDSEAAIAFYMRAFGWQFDDLGFATMIRRPGYGDHLEATVDPDIRVRQSGVKAPPGFEDAIAWLAPTAHGESPHWHVSFTVADRDQTVVDALRLGADVVAQGDTDWTRDAVIRDPQGAEFTASQFTPPSG
jgi:predicted enzyme related to lactoylglutathione lyase